LLCKSEAEFARFRPVGQPQAAGFFSAGRQYDYIVMWDGPVRGNEAVIFHEYLHFFLHERNLPVPHWFEEGMSELFSNVEIAGSEIRVGVPIENHVRRLLAEQDIDVGTLFRPGNDPLFYAEVFYAKSWALVRLLTLDEHYRLEVGRFLALVAGGETHATGFRKAFGKTVEEVSEDVRRSLGSARPWVLTPATSPAAERARAIPQTACAADLVIAALLENLQRFDEAKRILASLAKENSRNPEVESQLGDICMREAKPDDAFEHYSRAIEFGTRDARVYFERAMIRRDDAAARGQAIADLREAVRLDPEYAEAYQQLDTLILRDQPSLPHKSSTEWKNRTGDRTVEGTLVEMDCSSAPPRMVVDTPGGELTLTVSDPAKVLIGNDPGVSAELNCGRMSPRPVRVEYLEESRQITAIQFK
jgi:hypothetical protein